MSDDPAPIADTDADLRPDDGAMPFERIEMLDEASLGSIPLEDEPADENKPDKPNTGFPDLFDSLAFAVGLPDPPSFLGSLVGAVSRQLRRGTGSAPERTVDIVRRILGFGIAQGLDESTVFEALVDTLIRKGLPSAALQDLLPIVAAFFARIASEPIRLSLAEPDDPTDFAPLVHTAIQILAEVLEGQGPRGWRKIPATAAAIAARVDRQRLSVGDLAAALPRLCGRAERNQEKGPAPPADRSGTRVKQRRIVFSGPVEIVILER